MLKRHPKPAVDAQGPGYLKRADGQVDRANVAGGIHRALRLLRRNWVSEKTRGDAKRHFEVSTSTPWSVYGEALRTGVDTYKTVFVHIEVNSRGRPVLMILATVTGVTAVFKLPADERLDHWSCFRRNFRKASDLLADPSVMKLTTTYEETRKFLDLRQPSRPDKVVDALTLADMIREEDFADVERDEECSERLAQLCLIWSTLGGHSGPVYFADWETVYGNKVPYPSDRKPDRLLAWPRAHRHEPLTNAQSVYTEQIARAACIMWMHYLLWKANHSELVTDLSEFERAALACLERSYPESLQHGRGWASTYGDRSDTQERASTARTTTSTTTTGAEPFRGDSEPYDPERPSTSAATKPEKNVARWIKPRGV